MNAPPPRLASSLVIYIFISPREKPRSLHFAAFNPRRSLSLSLAASRNHAVGVAVNPPPAASGALPASCPGAAHPLIRRRSLRTIDVPHIGWLAPAH